MIGIIHKEDTMTYRDKKCPLNRDCRKLKANFPGPGSRIYSPIQKDCVWYKNSYQKSICILPNSVEFLNK